MVKVMQFVLMMTITTITFCAYFLSWNKTRSSQYDLESLVSYCVDMWLTLFFFSFFLLFLFRSACQLGDFDLEESTASANQRGG
jgi:hypothetical protein